MPKVRQGIEPWSPDAQIPVVLTTSPHSPPRAVNVTALIVRSPERASGSDFGTWCPPASSDSGVTHGIASPRASDQRKRAYPPPVWIWLQGCVPVTHLWQGGGSPWRRWGALPPLGSRC